MKEYNVGYTLLCSGETIICPINLKLRMKRVVPVGHGYDLSNRCVFTITAFALLFQKYCEKKPDSICTTALTYFTKG